MNSLRCQVIIDLIDAELSNYDRWYRETFSFPGRSSGWVSRPCPSPANPLDACSTRPIGAWKTEAWGMENRGMSRGPVLFGRGLRQEQRAA